MIINTILYWLETEINSKKKSLIGIDWIGKDDGLLRIKSMFNAVINAFLTETSSTNKTLVCFNIKSALKKENILFLIIGVFLALVAMIFNYYLEFKFLYILFYPFVCIYIFFCCLYAFVDLNSLKKK